MSSLPARLRHGYGVGALSFAIANTTLLFFLMKYLVDEAKLGPALAGNVVLVAKIWDAVIDPVIGRLAGRGSPPRWVGRAMVPLGICFAGIWWGIPLQGTAAAVAYTLLLVLYSTAFSSAVIPYGAMTPALAPDYDDRTALNGSRMAWSMVGGIVAGVGVPILVTQGGFRVAGLVLGAATIPPLAVVWWTTRHSRAAAEPEAGSLAPPWAVLKVPAYRRVALVFVLAWSTIAVLSALIPFYVERHLEQPKLLDALFGAIQVSALLNIPLVTWAAGKLQKHVAMTFAMATWAVVMVGLALVPTGAGTAAIVLAVLAGPGVAAAHVLPWSMLPDVVDVDKAETGVDRTGDFYGMMTFLEQVTTGAAIWMMGQVLDAFGYVEGAATQPEGAVLAIRLLIGPGPAVILVFVALYAWLRPPLTREQHEAAVRKLGAAG